MKKQTKRTLMFYVMMAVAMALPTSLFAQRESYGGIFGTNADAKETQNKSLMGGQNRGTFTGTNTPGIGNQGFNQDPVPVGSGVLMLIVAGAGYAILKSKKSNK